MSGHEPSNGIAGLNGKTKWVVGGSSLLGVLGIVWGYTNSTSKDLAAMDQRIVKNAGDINDLKDTIKTMSLNRYKDSDAARDFGRNDIHFQDIESRLRSVEKRESKP